MKAAIVSGPGQAPRLGEFDAPVAGEGEIVLDVTAAAISRFTRGRASGAHYSSSGGYPLVVGVDGVGRTADGERRYFVLPRMPFGAMAEHTVVPVARTIPVPDAIDDMTAAAIANPGMSSWAALTERAHLKRGETVLINGATGTSGQLAIHIARHLGAAKVIATGRNADALAALGADATVMLGEDGDALEAAFKAQFAGGVDVVLDYLWGQSAERMLIAAAKAGQTGARLRFVQIGTMSGADITLPGAVLRSSAIELMGSGVGSVSLERLVASVGGVFKAAVADGFALATQTAPLADVERAWSDQGDARMVIVP